ncbi:VPA1262 family protein [Proteus vulgaris]|uniref:VPA1262 family protein n=2 Tax=Proteus TaxID=583 RepID=UPI00352568E9
MATTLDDLLGDGRLVRLFSNENRACALQLWVLQIKSEQQTELRLVYGRLLPYSHSNNCWSFSDNDNYLVLGNFKAKLTRLNLYIDSINCVELLRQLCSGRSISEINELLRIECPRKVTEQFGATALVPNNLTYRPASYLLNRDAHDNRSLSSPHGAAGAISASITQLSKDALFLLNGEYSAALIIALVEQLNAETGLDFGAVDTTRFGDIELLVFPTLNDLEQNLLSIEWIDSPRALSVRFDPIQVSFFNKFQFHLSIENDDQIISSTIASANCEEGGVYKYVFQVSKELWERTDNTELEIFGFSNDYPNEGVLCCRWRVGYVREINVLGHMVRQEASPVRFDWLEKATRPAMSERVKAALTVNRSNLGFGSSVGGRQADPWVPPNHELLSLFTRFHPPKSEGQFFQRWSMGDGEGRLQFVEWFKSLLSKYQQNQVVIFDPYFETAGLGLMLICAARNSDYIIFTSLPKPLKVDEDVPDEHGQFTSGRVNNLVASCNHNRNLLNRIKFRIYGLKEGRLHDRYILIMGPDELPIAGFHLSNSFQKAAENYPLLITPIPADVLLQVEQYKSAMVKDAMATKSDSKVENSVMRLIFDSTVSSSTQECYEPLSFLEKCDAGYVLGLWSGENSLKGLSGDQLRTQMKALGLLRNNSLILKDGLKNCINMQEVNIKNFISVWEILGEILAHSSVGDTKLRYLELEQGFLEFLRQYLNSSFERVHNNMDKELITLDVQLFHKPIEILLHCPYRTEQLCHTIKYNALTWSEYFAIKFLWLYAPNYLLNITEAQILTLPIEPNETEALRLSLLSQIISEISLSIEFGINKIQLDNLIHSEQGLLRWMGLNALERQLDSPDAYVSTLSLLEAFSYEERIRALGWMVHHAAMNSNKKETFKNLVAVLHKILPDVVIAEDLRVLVDSMRGHMKQLSWAEPWLFQDVVFPLLQSERVLTEDACDIWMQELASMLELYSNNQSHLFERSREGQTTNIASYLFASCTPEQRKVSLKIIDDILRRKRRIIQQPLASTSDWSRWDNALRVSLWILSFAKWSEFYLSALGTFDQNLERLSGDAQRLVMVRTKEEWQSEGVGIQSELIEFLEQGERLLSEGGRLKNDYHKLN